jgi:hypothetical protein
MRCTQCAAASYSAAARTLVSRGERCPQCGGELVLDLEQPSPSPVGTGAREQDVPEPSEPSERRFERD